MPVKTKQDLLDVLTRTMDGSWLDPIMASNDARAAFDAAATALAKISLDGQEGVDNTTITLSAAGRGGSSTVTLTRTASGTSGTIPKGYAFIDPRGFQAVTITDVVVGSGVTSIQVMVETVRKTELVDTVNDPLFVISGNLPVLDNGGTNALISQTPLPSGYPPIVSTTFTVVASSTPIINGASDWLAAVGRERGQLRQASESDASFRLRVRNVPDAVTPVAVSQGIEAAATALALPSPHLFECLNPSCSAQALADAQVHWFDSVFFSGLLDNDGDRELSSPKTDFMEDTQPDLVNLKPREMVSLREARCYFRILESGLVPDTDNGRMFFDNAFFDDPVQGFPDIQNNTKLLGALMSIWEEADRKRAAGVRFDLYLEASIRPTGVGTTTQGTEQTVFTLTPAGGKKWLMVDGHFGWDAPTVPTSATARLKFTFSDTTTYFTPANPNTWGQRVKGTEVVGGTPTSRVVTQVQGLLTSDGTVNSRLVANLIVIEAVI